MSHFDGRKELGAAARRTIERLAGSLRKLADQLHDPNAGARERQEALVGFLRVQGFSVQSGIGGVEHAFIARRERLNREDMRKGLRHGHVAFACAASAPVGDDGIGCAPVDMVAAAASAVGLAATLNQKIYGTVSLICVPSLADLPQLIEADVFEEPDCVLLLRGDATGHGFQHIINNTGEHLAQMALGFTLAEGGNQFILELQAAVRAIIDELEEPDTIVPAPNGFVIRARAAGTINEAADRITALARTRAESSGIELEIERSPLVPAFHPSRILARRIKTFADTFKLGHDRVVKEPAGAPTAWGGVSQVAATAKVRFPYSGAFEIDDADLRQALNVATATASAGLDMLGDMEFRGFVEGELIRGLRHRGIVRTPRRWLGVHPVLPREDYKPAKVDFPDVVVRGPGLPDPFPFNRQDDDES